MSSVFAEIYKETLGITIFMQKRNPVDNHNNVRENNNNNKIKFDQPDR